jgi:hypothetical protein
MANGSSSPFERNRGFWWIVAVLVGLNLWFDYYHPLGFLFDIIILIVVIAKWPRTPRNP